MMIKSGMANAPTGGTPADIHLCGDQTCQLCKLKLKEELDKNDKDNARITGEVVEKMVDVEVAKTTMAKGRIADLEKELDQANAQIAKLIVRPKDSSSPSSPEGKLSDSLARDLGKKCKEREEEIADLKKQVGTQLEENEKLYKENQDYWNTWTDPEDTKKEIDELKRANGNLKEQLDLLREILSARDDKGPNASAGAARDSEPTTQPSDRPGASHPGCPVPRDHLVLPMRIRLLKAMPRTLDD